MHSLKNTIVAVGLLGLSFVFYQMSTPDQNNLEELTPPIVTDLQSGLADAAPTDKLRPPSLKGPMSIKSDNSPLMANKPEHLKLPLPEVNSSLATARPKFIPPARTQPSTSIKSQQPTFKPRPEAEFDFAAKSHTPLSPPTKVQQRDQGLITALKNQQQAPDGSQLKASNTFQPNGKLSVQHAPLIQDSAVAKVSTDGDTNAFDRFKLQPKHNALYDGLTLKTAWSTIETLIAEKQFHKSLELLTHFYSSSELTGPQRQRLDPWLDGLAAKVVFSDEHHLAAPYISQPGDSLLELGRAWGVPGQLIFNVNKKKILGLPDDSVILASHTEPEQLTKTINNPYATNVIPPGTELKKITGPINASVNLENNTLTLFVEGLYAGRFDTKVGISGSPRPGDFKVVGKLPGGHDWKDATGTYPPGHSNNHYGKYWIALEGSLCLHAIDANTDNGHLGCIGLSEKDAMDLFSILSEGSTVSIK